MVPPPLPMHPWLWVRGIAGGRGWTVPCLDSVQCAGEGGGLRDTSPTRVEGSTVTANAHRTSAFQNFHHRSESYPGSSTSAVLDPSVFGEALMRSNSQKVKGAQPHPPSPPGHMVCVAAAHCVRDVVTGGRQLISQIPRDAVCR